MSQTKLPKECVSQEIGQYAILSFNVSYPVSWRVKDLAGDDDVGYDFQVQVIDDRQYSYIFRAQLKSSRQSDEEGKTKLSGCGTYFSQVLKVSTINYCLRSAEPLMLLYVDLTADENPRNCPVYYLWLDSEIDKLRGSKRDLSHLNQDSVTFRIPISNQLTPELDAIPHLKRVYEKHIALGDVFQTIEAQKDDPFEVINKLSEKFKSSPSSLDSVLEDRDTPWLDAPRGSLSHDLKESFTYLQNNDLHLAREILSEVVKRVEELNPHEQSEFNYQLGRLSYLSGKEKESIAHFKQAFESLPDNLRYLVAYYEHLVNANYLDKELIAGVLDSLPPEGLLEIDKLKAKALSLLGRHDEAFGVLGRYDDKDVCVVRAIALFMAKQFDECVAYCEKCSDIVRLPRLKHSLLNLKIRSLFNTCASLMPEEDGHLNFLAIRVYDQERLRTCWETCKECWGVAKSLNYPRDLELNFDIFSVLAFYYEEVSVLIYNLKEFIYSNDKLTEAYRLLVNIGASTDDTELIEWALGRVDDASEFIEQSIIFNYKKSNKSVVVNLINNNIKKLQESKNFIILLSVGAQCADELNLHDKKNFFLEFLGQQEEGETYLAIHEYFAGVNHNVLSKDEAIIKLYEKYVSGDKNRDLIENIFSHLSSYESSQAQYIIEIFPEISKYREFRESEIYKITQSFSTLGKWEELLSYADQSIERLGRKPKLIAIRATALDELGLASEALNDLESLVQSEEFDDYAFNLYTNIAARCGFADKAKATLNRLYEKTEGKERLEIIRALFSLEMYVDPSSQSLYDLAKRYGELCNREDEKEEGVYLQLFLGGTLSPEINVPEEELKAFHKRIEVYTSKFPSSEFLRLAHLPSDGQPEELIRQLKQLSGSTAQSEARYEIQLNFLRKNPHVIPYRLKPKVLRGVGNILELFTYTLRTNHGSSEYTLRIAEGSEFASSDKVFKKYPFVDETALFLLHELNLLPLLFKAYDFVYLSKKTLLDIVNYANPFLSPVHFNRARNLLDFLKENIGKIRQPSINQNVSSSSLEILDEHRNIIETNDLSYFTCDFSSSVYVRHGADELVVFNILDFVNASREQGLIEDPQVVTVLAKLCKFNVLGVFMHFDDIHRAVMNFSGIADDDSLATVRDKLLACDEFMSLSGYVLDTVDDYNVFLSNFASVIEIALAEEGQIKLLNENLIPAIMTLWASRCLFMRSGSGNYIDVLADLFVSVVVGFLRKGKQDSLLPDKIRRFASLYDDAISFYYGGRMDESLYDSSITKLAGKCFNASGKYGSEVYSLCERGFKDSSRELELFKKTYVSRVVKYEKARDKS